MARLRLVWLGALAMSLTVACGAPGPMGRLEPAGSTPSPAMESHVSPDTRSATLGSRWVLQEFAPVSATTWWALVQGTQQPRTMVVRTGSAGRRWRDATPPARILGSPAFLSADVAWVQADAIRPPTKEPVYRTLNGGQTWRRLGAVASECQLDFVNVRDGWCTSIGAALGSTYVTLYRTTDGGSNWRRVYRRGGVAQQPRSGRLPVGCDKSLVFTSATVGWASSECNGGMPYLERTRDAGSRWFPVATVPQPQGITTEDSGGTLSAPVTRGLQLAATLTIDGTSHHRTVGISTSDNGGQTWRTQLLPRSDKYWSVSLITPVRWRATDGQTVIATNDAGRHWRAWHVHPALVDQYGSPMTLRFVSSRIGFANPVAANTGPILRTTDGGRTWHRLTITAQGDPGPVHG